MVRATFTVNRYRALEAVQQGKICHHNGLGGPSPGYAWVMGISRPMTNELHQAPRDLWTWDLIDIETHHLVARRGHRV